MAAPSSDSSGIEISAISVLKNAVMHDESKRYTSALVCYQEGIQLLLDVLKTTTDDAKRNNLRKRVTQYMDRAEEIKKTVQKEQEAGRYHEQIRIDAGSTGHSYDSLFGHLLDDSIRRCHIEDAYVRSKHQVQNLTRFSELLLRKCPKLKTISLETGADQVSQAAQEERFKQLRDSLRMHNVALEVSYSNTLHDRQIEFDNGWIIKIGRGLDYFRPTPNIFSIGFFDMNMRPCHETTVDIFHRKNMRRS